jgi:uncharacterized membrane protein
MHAPVPAWIYQALGAPFSLRQDALGSEQILLRWIHFVAGIIWVGLLYFFNLVGVPTMKQLESSVRAKIYPVLMSRAMWWFRWSALVTVLAGLRYFSEILAVDAQNAGNPALAWRWLGGWLVVWLAAYAVIYPLQLPSKGFFDNPWFRAISISVVVTAASFLALSLSASPQASNAHLAISVGGGLGLLMLLNAWGIVWRVQKRLIAWTRDSLEKGAPMPAEAERLARWGLIASRVGFWLSFPMLFFMAAAEHYPFLGDLAR